MTASSAYSGTVDNLWSRADILVHTSGGTPKAVEALLGDLFKGKPTRTAGAKRQGAEAAPSLRALQRAPARRRTRATEPSTAGRLVRSGWRGSGTRVEFCGRAWVAVGVPRVSYTHLRAHETDS